MSNVRSFPNKKELGELNFSTTTVQKLRTNNSQSNTGRKSGHNVIMESNTKPKGVISMNEDYVTRTELDMHSKMIDAKLDSIKDGTYAKIDSLSNELKYMSSNLTDNMEKTIKLALYQKEENDRKERAETKKYIIGTLLLGGISILVSIISLIR